MKEGRNANLKKLIDDTGRIYRLVDTKPTGPYTVTLVRVAASLAMTLPKSLHKIISLD